MAELNQHMALRYITERIIYYLVDNNEIIWKLLKYDSVDALFKPNLSRNEKISLIYTGNGDKSDTYKVFRQPYMDDAELTSTSMIRVFVSNIVPENKVVSNVAIAVECLVHSKNTMVQSNLDDITYENRLELLTQQILECLVGAKLGGTGTLFFDSESNYMNKATIGIYNNRNYHGFRIVLSTKVS